MTTWSRFALLALAAVLPLAGGCKRRIGDACKRSTDCSLQGERICDQSVRITEQGIRSPGGSGECTIEGCGRESCPDVGTCVKVYGSDFLSIACDPEREDIATFCDSDDPATCEAAGCALASDGSGDIVCPPRNDCDPNEVCLPEGLCADEITARTSCRKECKDNGDCRTGYECRRTGTGGVYRVLDPENPDDRSETRICMPAV